MSGRRLVVSLVGGPLAEEFIAQAADVLRRNPTAAGIGLLLAEAYLRGAREQQNVDLNRPSNWRETRHGEEPRQPGLLAPVSPLGSWSRRGGSAAAGVSGRVR